MRKRVEFYKTSANWNRSKREEFNVYWTRKGSLFFFACQIDSYLAKVIDILFLDKNFLNTKSGYTARFLTKKDLRFLNALLGRGSKRYGILRKFLRGEISKKELRERVLEEDTLKRICGERW